jgi:hypothetical protein
MADLSDWSIEASATTSVSPPTDGTDIYVDPINGDDANDGATPATAKRALHVVASDNVSVKAGTTIHLMEGIHDYTFTDHDNKRSVAFFRYQTGTAEAPITIQAMAGHEGRAIISGRDHDTLVQHTQHGIQFAGDHFHFRNLVFRDCQAFFIKSYGTNAQQSNPRWGNPGGTGGTFNTVTGLVVENCVFWDWYNTDITMCVRADGGDNAIMRHCFGGKGYRYQPGNGYVGYGYGMLMEQYCERATQILNCTAYWMQTVYFAKQASLTADTTAEPLQWEISHCYCERLLDGLKAEDANNFCPIGSVVLRHNIINQNTDDVTEGRGIGFNVVTQGTTHAGIGRMYEEQVGRHTIEHNTILGGRSVVVRNSGFGSISGNIILRGYGAGSEFTYTGANYGETLYAWEGIHGPVDHNVYGDFSSYFRATDGVVPQFETRYSSFAMWQAAQSGDNPYVKVSNPDANGVNVTTNILPTLFTSAAARDFTNAPGSPAIGLMPDGSNAGAYKTGDEVVGARLDWIDLTQFWPEIPDWLNPGKGTPVYPYTVVINPIIAGAANG